jgi:hypothetical protein
VTRKYFKEIIKYATTVPDPEADVIQIYTYPFIANELLSTTHGPLLDLYFASEDGEAKEDSLHSKEMSNDSHKNEPQITIQPMNQLKEIEPNSYESPNDGSAARTCDSETFAMIDEIHNESKYELVLFLFSFVDVEPDTEFNELLAGYFKGAAIALIESKPKEMVKFFEEHPLILENLFVNATNTSIAAVFCKALSLGDSTTEYFSHMRKCILHKLLNRLEDSSLVSYSIQQLSLVFCELVEEWVELANFCSSKEILTRIFELTLNKEKKVSMAGITILTKLLSKENFASFFEKQFKTSTCNDITSLIKKQLTTFKDALLEDYSSMNNQTRTQPFGSYRLKIIEYIYYLIKLTLFLAFDTMHQLKYPSLLYNLFARFPFNSLLHCQLYKIFETIFKSNRRSLVRIVLFIFQLVSA